MLTDYKEKIDKTTKELTAIKNKINHMQNSKNVIIKLFSINIYKNYAVILAYGCIESIVKNIIADYYKQPKLPIRCQSFADNLLENNYSLSICKERFNKFLKKDCSYKWFDEVKRREKLNLKDKKYKRFTMSQMYLAIDFIFGERCKFAHGESSYIGTINELTDNFKLAKAWLYELDNIVNNPKLSG